jgi:hypothetical protein
MGMAEEKEERTDGREGLKSKLIALLPASVGLELYRFFDRFHQVLEAVSDRASLNEGRMPSKSWGSKVRRAFVEDLSKVCGFITGVSLEVFSYFIPIAHTLYQVTSRERDYASAVVVPLGFALLRMGLYSRLRSRNESCRTTLKKMNEEIERKKGEVGKLERIREQWRR